MSLADALDDSGDWFSRAQRAAGHRVRSPHMRPGLVAHVGHLRESIRRAGAGVNGALIHGEDEAMAGSLRAAADALNAADQTLGAELEGLSDS